MDLKIVAPSKTEEAVSDAPGIVTVITAQDIRDFGALNLYEVLSRAPSVFMAGSYLYPQNVTSIRRDLADHVDNHVLLLLNGRPFRDYTQGGISRAFYLAFPVDVIERVELIRGPGSVLYGTNAFSGVVNVITREASAEPELSLAIGGGAYGAKSATLSGSGKRDELSYQFSVHGFDEDGWRFAAIDELGVAGSAHYAEETVGVFGELTYKNFAANVMAASVDEVHLGPTPVWPTGEITEDRLFLDLGYDGDLSETWSLATRPADRD